MLTYAARVLRWSFLLLLVGVVSLCTLAQDTATFKFTPADGLNYVETSRSKDTTEMSVDGGETHKDVSEQVIKAKTVIHKTATGYAITQTIQSVEKTSEGKTVDAETFLRASVNIPVTYHISTEGKLLSVDGLEKIAEKCALIMEPEEKLLYGPLITAKGQLEGVTGNWYENTQSLIGRTVKVGEPWKITVSEPMTNGKKLTATVETRMIGREQNGGREGIRLQYSKRYDLKALAAGRAYIFKMMFQSGDGEAVNPKVTIKEATETGDNVLNPDTLQPLASTSSKSTITLLTGPNNSTMQIIERTEEETTVDYNPGAFTGVNSENHNG